jgi:hypothetical protein
VALWLEKAARATTTSSPCWICPACINWQCVPRTLDACPRCEYAPSEGGAGRADAIRAQRKERDFIDIVPEEDCVHGHNTCAVRAYVRCALLAVD